MPVITAEEYCRKYEPDLPLAACLSKQTAEDARTVEIQTRCSWAFPTDVARNNECRAFCGPRTDDAASCVLTVTILLNDQRDFENAQRHHQIVTGSLLLVFAAIVSIFTLKRAARSAVARSIYAVSGFDVRR